MALNDLQIGQGDILSVEALEEARAKHRDARTRMESEHVYDAAGRLVHPQPRWSTAIAYLGIDPDSTLMARDPLMIRWAAGFKSAPRIEDTATIRWEIEARGPQLVHVGLEWRDGSFAYDFRNEIRFSAGGGGGQGTLFFSTAGGVEYSPRDVVDRLSGLLIVVRAF